MNFREFLRRLLQVYYAKPPVRKPEPAPEPKPTPEPVEPRENLVDTRAFSHYNPMSWHGQGVSIVFCRGHKYSSVSLNGRALRYHGMDKGRQAWTNHNFMGKSPTKVSGTILAVRDGITYRITVDGSSGQIVQGECWRK